MSPTFYWDTGGCLGASATTSGGFRAYVATLTVSLVGLLINNAIVWISVTVLSWPLVIAKVNATAVVMAFNFLARHHWVYRPRGHDLGR